MKKKFKIEGMSCAACQAHVNKAVTKLNVIDCNVSLLTNSMEVEYDENLVNESTIKDTISDAGYQVK